MSTDNPRVSAYLQPENYAVLIDYAARRGIALKAGKDGRAQVSSALINQVLAEVLIGSLPSGTPRSDSSTLEGYNGTLGNLPERLSQLERRVEALENQKATDGDRQDMPEVSGDDSQPELAQAQTDITELMWKFEGVLLKELKLGRQAKKAKDIRSLVKRFIEQEQSQLTI
ncbi:MAG: hypothetical protein F6J93_02925 [Oscillatoria sp. SIO1A7]|nr:hypothetical protein [Oscillatoria sp. SIO1A7]